MASVQKLAMQVIVVEDENGNIVRETMKDTDTLARYKTMHETLVYLSHFDHDDTENQMLTKLHLQVQRAKHAVQSCRFYNFKVDIVYRAPCVYLAKLLRSLLVYQVFRVPLLT